MPHLHLDRNSAQIAPNYVRVLMMFLAKPFLKIAVLHEGQVPFTAGLPFFIVYGLGLVISLLSRHFTQ